jgi:hypothetical protein
MPYKSKRNRRIPQRRKIAGALAENKPVSSGQTSAPRPEKMAAPYGGLKTTPVGVTSVPSFSRDLKWIGVVTAITVILLVAAYYIFH